MIKLFSTMFIKQAECAIILASWGTCTGTSTKHVNIVNVFSCNLFQKVQLSYILNS